MKNLILPMFLAVFLLACDNTPRIDTSSEEAMQASMEAVKAELTEKQKEDLNGALMILTLKGAFTEESTPEDNPINGKTAEEVIALAQEYADKEGNILQD